MTSIRVPFFLGLLLLAACGSVEPTGAPACRATPTVAPPWTTGKPGAVEDTSGQDATLLLGFEFEPGIPLLSLSAHVEPAVNHAALPARLPFFSLSDISPGGDPVDVVGTAFDGASALASYQQPHTLVLDLSPAQWSAVNDHTYSARFVSEGGSDSTPGLSIIGWTCQYSETR